MTEIHFDRRAFLAGPSAVGPLALVGCATLTLLERRVHSWMAA